MKNLYLLFSFVLMSIFAFGQTPQGINYQTVIRDGDGQLIVNTELTLKISIRAETADGEIVYSEIHEKVSNSFGLVNLVIGMGNPVFGEFSAIEWGIESFFLETAIDLAGNENYDVLGVTQILSVPYSKYSEKAGTLKDGTYPGEILFWDGNEWRAIVSGSYGQELILCNGVPTWGGCSPLVETSEVNVITFYLAHSGGTVMNDGGTPVTQRGVCWSTMNNPTIDNNDGFTIDGNGTGMFESTLNNLTAETNYYLRAYAVNSKGTAYGVERSFTTLPTNFTCGNIILDKRDSMQYSSVQIGNQCWMSENLSFLPYVNPPSYSSQTLKYYYVHDYYGTNVNEAKNSTDYQNYGVLYNWQASLTACPAGWHLPSHDEWDDLVNYLGGMEEAGGKLKGTPTAPDPHPRWDSPNIGATNESGFSAFPGGLRSSFFVVFSNFGNFGSFWTSTNYIYSPDNSFSSDIKRENTAVLPNVYSKSFGNSVRCLWDYSGQQNQPPLQPFNPTPINNATNQPLDIILTWFCTDPESNPLTYDICFGTNDNPTVVVSGLTDQTFTPEILNFSTTYYWQVIAHDNQGSITESTIWNFTTMAENNQQNQPPLLPYNPMPVNGSKERPLTIILSWDCTDPNYDPIYYDVCFGTFQNPPFVAGGITEQSYLIDTFNYSTTYYWKIIAHDNQGNITQGDIWSFSTMSNPNWQCSETITDTRDSNLYVTVKIGSQCWMAENLSYLPSVSLSSQGSETEPFYYVYNYEGTSVADAKNTDNFQNYGVLYNWPASLTACPVGWHLPSHLEWSVLRDYLGGSQIAGGKMKSTATSPDPHPRWYDPNYGATNESGFNAFPGGYRNGDNFGGIESLGNWWSSTNSFYSLLYSHLEELNFQSYSTVKYIGRSARCIRDN